MHLPVKVKTQRSCFFSPKVLLDLHSYVFDLPDVPALIATFSTVLVVTVTLCHRTMDVEPDRTIWLAHCACARLMLIPWPSTL